MTQELINRKDTQMDITPCRDKWKGDMTSRERFNNQMHFKPVDRCFNMEFGYWDEVLKTWPILIENGITNNEQADIFFNFDKIEIKGFMGVKRRQSGWVWMLPEFQEKIIHKTKTTNIVQNCDGMLAEVPKDGHDSIPHYIKSPIVTPEDWAKIKAERFDPDHPDRKVDIEALKKMYPSDRDFPAGVYGGSMIGKIRDVLTFEGLAYACHDYPAMVEDMVETSCVMVENFLDQVLGEVDFDFASGWEDICFKNGPIVTVNFFKNVVVPRYKRISAKLKAAGVNLWYVDCDGDVSSLVPHFLEGGVNCLLPFEVNSGGHPGKLLDEYGKDLRITGGVDKIEIAKGPDTIKKYLESIAPYVERGGFIPHIDHRCPPSIEQKDYLYYLDLKEEMFGLK